MPHSFTATLEIIGVNPFVAVPKGILDRIFDAAAKSSGPIPVSGTINDTPYTHTLVRYAGAWRLYVNMMMLPDSPRRIGETLRLTIDFDPQDRTIPMPPALAAALEADSKAAAVFGSLRPSLQEELRRYIGSLKTPASVERNVARAIDFLHGKGRFIGRDCIEDSTDLPPL